MQTLTTKCVISISNKFILDLQKSILHLYSIHSNAEVHVPYVLMDPNSPKSESLGSSDIESKLEKILYAVWS